MLNESYNDWIHAKDASHGITGDRLLARLITMLAYIGVVIVVLPTSLWLYSRISSKKPQIYAKADGSLLVRVKKNVPALQKVYRIPWWCPFGDAQTIVNGALRKCPTLPFV
ncbi:hypothetical protein OSTOST_18030, partial [Ostertagia ostertagi]